MDVDVDVVDSMVGLTVDVIVILDPLKQTVVVVVVVQA